MIVSVEFFDQLIFVFLEVNLVLSLLADFDLENFRLELTHSRVGLEDLLVRLLQVVAILHLSEHFLLLVDKSLLKLDLLESLETLTILIRVDHEQVVGPVLRAL